MTTLLDVLHTADSIEIDDYFIRNFGIDIDGIDEDEGDEAVCLEVETVDDNYNKWEWFFTIKELKDAKYVSETNEWEVYQYGEKEPYMITAYSLTALGKE